MSLELVNTLATFGTFVVIAATAIAAIVQLRHARSSNHIAALNELRETQETPDFQAAQHFVQTQLAAKLQDPDFRYQVVHPAARTDEIRPLLVMVRAIGNFYEGVGVLIRAGLVDRELVLRIWSSNIVGAWENVVTYAALARRRVGTNALWENFEYLTVVAQDWMAAHPKGTYPAGARRIEVKDEWLEADEQYAASRATA
jgi:hypothetical protein